MKLTTTFFLLTMFLLLLPDATLSEAKTNYSIHNFTTKYTDKLVKNRSVIEDKRGIVYIGNNNGVLEYDGVTWRLIKLPDSKQVYSLGIDTSGRIYVGGNSEFGYLSSDHDGRLHYQSLLSTISEKDRTFKDNINEICFSSKEIYFIADKLLFIVNRNDTLKNATVVKASDFFYSSVCIDDQLFISDGEAGLMKLISGSLKPVADGGTILSYVMLPFNKKKVLIITPDKGAFLYNFHSIVKDKSAFTPFPLSDVITTFDIKSGVVINDSLYALGSVRNGCSIIDSTGRLHLKINEQNGLQNSVVYDIHEDLNGNLLLGLDQGISIVKLSENDAKTNAYEFRSFVRSFRGRESDTSFFDGAFYTVNTVPALNQPESQLFKFNYTMNSFRLSYASNYYLKPDSTMYQFFLQGLDTGWGDWSDRTYCEYTNLDRGKYVFSVRAKNVQGEISQTATYSFYINAPWFKSWWFYGSQIGILFLLLVISTFLYKIGKVEKLAGKLTGIVVVIGFEYLNLAIYPLVEKIATGIAIFDMIMNIVVANVVSPVQDLTNKIMETIVKGPHQKKESYYADKLTKAYNSTYIQEFLEKEAAQTKRYDKELTCIMINIDNLKELTVRNGRGAKNAILKQFATLIKGAIRQADIFGRLNDNLFLLILPETNLGNAKVVAEKLHLKIADTKFLYKKKEVSVAIRTALSDAAAIQKYSIDEIIQNANTNLQQV